MQMRDADSQKITQTTERMQDFRDNLRQYFVIFLSCARHRGLRRERRHGFVGLSPCFSRVLAPVSAESRHEAK